LLFFFFSPLSCFSFQEAPPAYLLADLPTGPGVDAPQIPPPIKLELLVQPRPVCRIFIPQQSSPFFASVASHFSVFPPGTAFSLLSPRTVSEIDNVPPSLDSSKIPWCIGYCFSFVRRAPSNQELWSLWSQKVNLDPRLAFPFLVYFSLIPPNLIPLPSGIFPSFSLWKCGRHEEKTLFFPCTS